MSEVPDIATTRLALRQWREDDMDTLKVFEAAFDRTLSDPTCPYLALSRN